jgi:hypothetical protein
MPAGFQSFAADGSNVVQIDSDIGLPNLQLRTKTTQTLAAGGFQVYTISDGSTRSSSGFVTTFSFSALNPLVAFECSGGYMTPMTWSKSGNGYSVTVVGTSGAAVTMYVFDTNDWATSSSHYGLQVFNASGVLVADALSPFAKPVGTIHGNPKYAYGSTGYASDSGTWATSQGSYGFSVLERVAVACIQPAYVVGAGAGGQTNAGVYLSTYNTVGGTVNVNMDSFGDNRNFNNYVGFREALNWEFTAIDVSYL